MTTEEFGAAAAAAKDAYERETRDLEAQLDRTRVKAQRLEMRLSAIRDQYQQRVSHLTASFLGLSTPEAPQPSPSHATESEPRKRRGTLDEPVLALAKELASPDVFSRQIEEAWNQQNPGHKITDSTVRSILNRLLKRGLLEIADAGGGKGSGIPRKYRPVKP